jgi:transmembrane sensor
MQAKRFVYVLKKYLEGGLPSQLTFLVEQWFASIGKDDVPNDAIEETEEKELRDQYYQGVQQRIYERYKAKQIRRLIWQKFSMAALFLIFSSLGIYLYTAKLPATVITEGAGGEVIFNNNENRDKIISLPDGSMVTLASGGELKYCSQHGKGTREVYLQGIAFFDVAHHAAKPFLVHAGNITTKVLGTMFRIENNKGDEVKVIVKTGRVSVFENNAKDASNPVQEVILTPNQQVVYNCKERKLVSQLVEKPEPILATGDDQLNPVPGRFREARVSEIFKAMEKLYGLPILYDSLQFQNCRVTTSLKKGDLHDRLAIVCEVLDARYSIEGVTIKITKESPCN